MLFRLTMSSSNCGIVRASRVFQTSNALENFYARTDQLGISHNSTCNVRNLSRVRAKSYKFAETVGES